MKKIWIYIVGSLILYWGLVTFFSTQNTNVFSSILIQEYKITNVNNVDLYAGVKVLQEVVPKFNNLGIIAIRFQTFDKSNNDTLIFRLKEKGSSSWHYTAKYKTDQIQNHQLFPFGFPIINDSKGKTYQIEIESLSGTQFDHVKIDNLLPNLESTHKYAINIKNIFSKETLAFVILKINNVIKNISIIYLILYFIPILIILLILYRSRCHLKEKLQSIIKKYSIILFSLGLFIYWVMISYVYLHKLDPSFSILIQEYKITNVNNVDLYAGVKVLQEVVPKFNNLGIIAIRFQTFDKSNNDTLIFRLKEKGSSSWHYTAKYKTDQIQNHQLFPFGFPIINDSKGKTYQIEIESLSGTQFDHVKIDNLLPTIISKHQFHISNFSLVSISTHKYIIQKIFNVISIFPIFYPIILYFIPFTFFLFLIRLSKKHIITSYFAIIIPILFMLIRAPLLIPQPPYWELTILIIWCIYLYANKLSSKINLIVAFCILPYIVFQIIENNFSKVEAGSFWLFIFLGIAFVYNITISILSIKTISPNIYFSNLFRRER